MTGRSRACPPVGFLAALAAIVAIESILQAIRPEPVGKLAMAWRFAADAATGRANDSRVLAFGDSLTKLGVQPRVLEAVLGTRAYNLAVPGGQTPTTKLLFDRAWEAGVRPSVILVNTDANLLAVAPAENRPNWGRLATSIESLELAARAGDPTLLARAWLARLPSVRERETWRMLVLCAVADRSTAAIRPDAHLWQNWTANRGAQLAADEPLSPRAAAIGGSIRRWRPHPTNEYYLRRLLDAAERRGVRVVWLIPPASRTWRERRGAHGADRAFDRWADSLLSDHEGVTLLDGRTAEYEDACFRDNTHLGRRGAVRFSAELAEAIRPIIEGRPTARRLSLRAVEPTTRFAALEDVEASRRRIAADSAGGRLR